ncbi:uncharacterized protein LOC106657189 isoform X2 [Trichogramma pretiosum]|uniref:uncharacterized protein LOC106657189 isoform X2 n=1 Tax=Trichogramma pretiosum TaxID=7493 RepID=UPI0006C9A519|nr:uncharacterized protein LOC106657189 isoform X2 [Trichogramma pretiosum]
MKLLGRAVGKEKRQRKLEEQRRRQQQNDKKHIEYIPIAHCSKIPGVMTTTTDPSITLQDEQRQTGKITPSSPRSNNSTTESSKSMGGGSGGGSDSSPRDSASTKSEELEVPVLKSTLPMPQSVITRVPTAAGDHVDSVAKLKNNLNGGGGGEDPSVEKLHAAAGEHNGLGAAAGGGEDEEERVDLNDIPFIVNCLYVTQQCCECSIM